MNFKSIKDFPGAPATLKGKQVLLRLDLNAPIALDPLSGNHVVTDDFRLQSSLDTLNFLREAGARTIVVSHIEGKGGETLLPVYRMFVEKFGLHIKFVADCMSEEANAAARALEDGEFLLLENLRAYPGEKNNDPEFARLLASMADIYVNDAFPVSHRAHASIVGVPKIIPGFAGIRFEKEIAELSTALNPSHPFLFILGGAKFDTKLPLIEKFLKIADKVFIGGALANDCFKAKGMQVGKSVVSDGSFDLSSIVAEIANGKVILPTDVVVEREGQRETIPASDVQAGDRIWDAGTETLEMLVKEVAAAKFILWNGPLGNYEIGFTEGTRGLAKIIAEVSGRGGEAARSIIGGGDTVASIRNLGLEDKFSFLSTGGGATLDFLVNETSPGIEALNSLSFLN